MELTTRAFSNERSYASTRGVGLFAHVLRNWEEYDDATISSSCAATKPVTVRGDMWSALRQLEDMHRAVVILFYCSSYSLEEISQIVQLPQFMVHSRIVEGKDHLHGCMSEWRGER